MNISPCASPGSSPEIIVEAVDDDGDDDAISVNDDGGGDGGDKEDVSGRSISVTV